LLIASSSSSFSHFFSSSSSSASKYFNKYAFCYVGIYGYDFLSAGKNVVTLFKRRGWSLIITDSLVNNVLFFGSLSIATLTGGMGMLIGKLFPNSYAEVENAEGILFFIGFLCGLIISMILFSIIDSAIATVFVCYAESPDDLLKNHPVNAQELNTAWRQGKSNLSNTVCH
jgi:hypothetical protein